MEYPDKYWVYYLCGKQFGWTPEQVDNQPAHIVEWVLAISEVVTEVENERSG
jgi:hypothetical protein